MPAIIVPNRVNGTKEAMFMAAEKAQEFMQRLFSGEPMSKCSCGKPLFYNVLDKHLKCPDCGTLHTVVGYIQEYGKECFIQTEVDLAARRFHLTISTTEEFD